MSENQEYLIDEYFIEEPRKAIHYFWLGFSIFTVSSTLMAANFPSSKICIILQLLGILIFIPSAFHLVRFEIQNRYLAILFLLYLCWSFIIIARGLNVNGDKGYFLNIVINPYDGIFLYFAPLILLFPKNLIYIKKVLNVGILLSALFLVFSVYSLDQLLGPRSEQGQDIIEGYARFLVLPIGFVLLLNRYQTSRTNLFSFFIILLTFLLAVIRARRGLLFISVNIIVFSFIFYFYANKGNLIKRFLPLVLVPLLLLYVEKVYEENKAGSFSYLTERITEDTRTQVLAFFYLDMNTNDWIIGRGMGGEYYCPVIDDSLSDYRNTIENDYLQIILKGGIISLGILLLITIPAIIKGLFYSRNILSKAAGLWILFWLVNMYPTTVTDFALNYLMVWMCVGICYSPEIRDLPNEHVQEFFLENKTRFLI